MAAGYVPHLFSNLRKFATKELKFQTRKSYQLVDQQAFPNGICMGITMEWVTEQIKEEGTSGIHRNFKKQLFVNRTKANAQLVKASQASHAAFDGEGGTPESAARRHGLSFVDIHLPLNPSAFSSGEGTTVAIEEICSTAYLQPGRAAIISIDFLKPDTKDRFTSHAVGVYRTKTSNLLFFDSNVGVYRVRNLRSFIEAWISDYKLGKRVIIRIGRKATYCYFSSL